MPFRNTHRRGIATLEMILALPTIMFLFVMIFYVASAGKQKYELVSQCRNDAWEKRTTTRPAPFRLCEPGNGLIQESQSNVKVKTDLFFDRWEQKISTHHHLIAGTWDFRSVSLNNPDNRIACLPLFNDEAIQWAVYYVETLPVNPGLTSQAFRTVADVQGSAQINISHPGIGAFRVTAELVPGCSQVYIQYKLHQNLQNLCQEIEDIIKKYLNLSWADVKNIIISNATQWLEKEFAEEFETARKIFQTAQDVYDYARMIIKVVEEFDEEIKELCQMAKREILETIGKEFNELREKAIQILEYQLRIVQLTREWIEIKDAEIRKEIKAELDAVARDLKLAQDILDQEIKKVSEFIDEAALLATALRKIRINWDELLSFSNLEEILKKGIRGTKLEEELKQLEKDILTEINVQKRIVDEVKSLLNNLDIDDRFLSSYVNTAVSKLKKMADDAIDALFSQIYGQLQLLGSQFKDSKIAQDVQKVIHETKSEVSSIWGEVKGEVGDLLHELNTDLLSFEKELNTKLGSVSLNLNVPVDLSDVYKKASEKLTNFDQKVDKLMNTIDVDIPLDKLDQMIGKMEAEIRRTQDGLLGQISMHVSLLSLKLQRIIGEAKEVADKINQTLGEIQTDLDKYKARLDEIEEYIEKVKLDEIESA